MSQSQAVSQYLGTIAKSVNGGGSDRVVSKSERFELLRIAQRLRYVQGGTPSEQPRVCWCHRNARTDSLPLYRAEDGSNARIGAVTTCGNVWDCPVCSSKIAEERRAEVAAAMRLHCEAGGYAYLMTLTFPHEADQPLAELLERFAAAQRYFRNSRTYKRILRTEKEGREAGEAGSVGFIRGLEVTIGANGWHPHTHELVMCRPGGLGETSQADNGDLAGRLIDELKGEWVRALQKAGLCDGTEVSDAFAHGLNVRGGEYAAEYIAKFGHDSKWGASSELTRAKSKVGAAGMVAGEMHFTPFQLLAWIAGTPDDAWAMAKFREYAAAFEGKRMLVWSVGLKDRYGIRDLSDEELADADRPELPDEHVVGTITPEDLSLIVSRGAMGEFHTVVARHCRPDAENPGHVAQILADYFEELRRRPKVGRGAIQIRRTFSRGRDVVDFSMENAA